MSSRVFSALLAMSAVLLAGCTAPTSEPARRTGLLIEPFDADNVGYVINWSTHLKVPPGQRLHSVTVLGDLVVTIESPGNMVTATSIRDGSPVWRRILAKPTEKLYAPNRVDDFLYINTDYEMMTVNVRNGRITSQSLLDYVVNSSPVIVDRYAIFGGADGVVFAHDLQAGYAKWAYKLTSRILASPIQSGVNVFAADSSGVYAMLDGRDGTLLWRGRTFGPVTAQAAIDRLGVYVASEDRAMYALNRTTGADKWIYRTDHELTFSPVPIGLNVYLPEPAGQLVAINTIDGSVRWTLEEMAIPVWSTDERLMVATDHSLMLLNPETGVILDQAPTLRLQKVVPGPDGSIILVSPEGRMLRLNPAS